MIMIMQISGDLNIMIIKRRMRGRERESIGRESTGRSTVSNRGGMRVRLRRIFWSRSLTTSTATLLPLSERNVSRSESRFRIYC